jgi:hypothetical protein
VVLLPLAHGLAVLQVAIQLAVVVWARPAPELRRWLGGAAVASGSLVVALLVVGISEVGDWVPPLDAATVSTYGRELVHLSPPITVLLLVVAALGARTTWRGPAATPAERFERVALLAWGPAASLSLLLLSTVRPSLMSRYAMASVLGTAGLWAVAAAQDRDRLPPSFAAVGLTVLLLVGQVPTGPPEREWSEAVAVVADGRPVGAPILFATPLVRMPFEAAWVDAGEPPAEVLGDGAPLGRFDRFGDASGVDALIDDLDGRPSLWIVDQGLSTSRSRLTDLLEDPRVADRYRVAERHDIDDGLQVFLLERR